MTGNKMKFGLTLPNRGVVIGATTVAEMLQLAADAESAGWDSVWVGDSIFAKPRLDAMVLLGAIAARTTRVRIGPACFASTPLRNALLLAYQWASLDFLSGGRTIFVACQGQAEPGGGAFENEQLEQSSIIVERATPFTVVVGDVKRVIGCPAAP